METSRWGGGGAHRAKRGYPAQFEWLSHTVNRKPQGGQGTVCRTHSRMQTLLDGVGSHMSVKCRDCWELTKNKVGLSSGKWLEP